MRTRAGRTAATEMMPRLTVTQGRAAWSDCRTVASGTGHAQRSAPNAKGGAHVLQTHGELRSRLVQTGESRSLHRVWFRRERRDFLSGLRNGRGSKRKGSSFGTSACGLRLNTPARGTRNLFSARDGPGGRGSTLARTGRVESLARRPRHDHAPGGSDSVRPARVPDLPRRPAPTRARRRRAPPRPPLQRARLCRPRGQVGERPERRRRLRCQDA